MAAASMSIADRVLRLPVVRVFAHPANAGSSRGPEKAGFEIVLFVPDMDRFLYRQRRQELPAAA